MIKGAGGDEKTDPQGLPADAVDVSDSSGTGKRPPSDATDSADCQPPMPLPSRDGSGSWDDIGEQQLLLTLAEPERDRVRGGGRRSTLLAAISSGVRNGHLAAYGNPPRYDRLVLWTTHSGGGGMPGSATYTVEAELDAWEGAGGWITKELTSGDLQRHGLLPLQPASLQAEYGGVLAFLEGAKLIGAPRYTMRTELDPSAKPHVIAVVEKLVAASSLRFLLSEDALERVDGDSA